MSNQSPRVLFFRIEPAGYMIALAKALREIWPGEIDVVFMNRALTQQWDIDNEDFSYDVLPRGRWQSAVAMNRRIRETKPDLLHIAGWSAPPSLAAIMSGDARGLPVVVDLDTWRGTPSPWRGAVKRVVFPRLFKRVTHFAPGGSRQAAYLRSFGVPDTAITPAHMTVDVTRIREVLKNQPNAGSDFRRRFDIKPDATVALFIGRLVSLKGIDDLLAAWPGVASQVPGIQLLIAGDGVLKDRINAAAATDPSIRPVGRLTGDEVWQAYAAADFAVAPSHFEPWGLVVNEAMAAGVPMIATDIFGSMGDLLRDDKTALVVPPGVPGRLCASMVRLALDPDLRHRLASAAGHLISDWTIEQQAERLVAIWQSELTASGEKTEAVSTAHAVLAASQ